MPVRGGEFLSSWITDFPPTAEAGLTIAIEICRALEQIHHCRIIHRDFKPHNILVDPHSCQVQLTGFTLATRFTVDHDRSEPYLVEGTPAYLSPEQTGRINRQIDYRSDFYSLGVTLYQLFSGHLPFTADDLQQWLHCHLSLQPRPLAELVEVPARLSAVVARLMAKAPEDRYRTAHGIEADLRLCLDDLDQGRPGGAIEIGRHDIPDSLSLCSQLYGREPEVARIAEVYAKIKSGQSGLVLISGAAGIGKTSLIHHARQILWPDNCHFGEGKFASRQEQIPYAALVDALHQLVDRLVSQAPRHFESWRDKFSEALGDNAKVITELLPRLELITGATPELPALPPIQAQNRFKVFFLKFIALFAQLDHPLILFLDDVQWTDLSFFDLLEAMLDSAAPAPLLIILAYRDQQVEQRPEIAAKLRHLGEICRYCVPITLTTPGTAALAEWLGDSLRRSPEELAELTAVIDDKTGGNPFFIGEFLQTAYERGWLSFSGDSGEWQWNLAQMRRQNITANVAELLSYRFGKLPSRVRANLIVAAHLGNTFHAAIIAAATGQAIEEVAADLRQSDYWGVITPLDNWADSSADVVLYRFVHDRLQEVAWSLLEPERRGELHRRIADYFCRRLPDRASSDYLFSAVYHGNQARDLPMSESQRRELIELNLQAAINSRRKNAYRQARHYSSIAVELLTEEDWHRHYSLSFAAHLEQAECEYLHAEYDQAQRIFELILANSASVLDQARVYTSLARLCFACDHFSEALIWASDGLNALGFKVVRPVPRRHLIGYLVQTATQLYRTGIDHLADLPSLQSDRDQAALRLLIDMAPAAFFNNEHELYVAVTLRATQICLSKGNSEIAPLAYMCSAMILAMVTKNLRLAHRLASQALSLSKTIASRDVAAQVNYLYTAFFMHWQTPIQDEPDIWPHVHRQLVEVGNFYYAAYASLLQVSQLWITGKSLRELRCHFRQALSFVHTTKKSVASYPLKAIHWLTLRLENIDHDFDRLLSDDECQKSQTDFPELQLWRWLVEMQVNYLTGEYLRAFELGTQFIAQDYMFANMMEMVEGNFYYCLALAAVYRRSTRPYQRRYLKLLRRRIRRFQKWNQCCPGNFAHKYWLLVAEQAQIEHRESAAIGFYDAAITASHEGGYTHNIALANELAAQFHFECGRTRIAGAYLKEAVQHYHQWGATAKVASLCRHYLWLPLAGTLTGTSTPKSGVTTASSALEILDMESFGKAYRTICSEIDLDRLIKRLMAIVMENAGAEYGALILEQDGKLVIAGHSRFGAQSIVMTSPVEITAGVAVAETVVRHAYRTRKLVVLADAAHDRLFAADPYIQSRRPRSILAIPLLKQENCLGVIYLENNLANDFFQPERVEILRLLTVPAVVSLENARLYKHIKQLNIELQWQLAAKKRLEKQILEVSDHEKNLLGQDLHDGLAQDLSGILFLSQALAEKIAERPAPAVEIAAKITDLLSESIRRARSMAYGLAPVSLKSKGLAIALQEMAAEITAKFAVCCRCENDDRPPVLDSALAIHLYRIAREAAINSAKHSRAKTIIIHLAQRDSQIVIEIEDDGCGFTPDADHQGMGLAIMHYRAEMIDAQFSIQSQLGQGTRITCAVAFGQA